MPAASELIALLLAEPAVSGTGPPKFTPSILNCTNPLVGFPDPAPVPTTVALKVTLSPKVDGLRLDETVVNVLRLLTVSGKGADVMPL